MDKVNANKVDVHIDRDSLDDSSTTLPVKCTIEGYGFSFPFYFPKGTTDEQIKDAISHKTVFLSGDMGLDLPAYQREAIIKLHEDAVNQLSSHDRERRI